MAPSVKLLGRRGRRPNTGWHRLISSEILHYRAKARRKTRSINIRWILGDIYATDTYIELLIAATYILLLIDCSLQLFLHSKATTHWSKWIEAIEVMK